MSMLQRFKTIMSSNINALLDKSDNPEKMVDQYVRDLSRELGRLKSEMVSVTAEEQRVKRLLDECRTDINKMQRYALKSIEYGNEDQARTFLEKKVELEEKEAELQTKYDYAQSTTEQMRQMHEKLDVDLHELEARRSLLKGRATTARAQKKMAGLNSSTHSSFSALDKMEEEVNRAFYEAEALAALRNGTVDELDKIQGDKNVSTDIPQKRSVEDELAKLKQQVKDTE